MRQPMIILLFIAIVLVLLLAGIVQAMFSNLPKPAKENKGNPPITELIPITFTGHPLVDHQKFVDFLSNTDRVPMPEFFFPNEISSDSNPFTSESSTNNDKIPPFTLPIHLLLDGGKFAGNDLFHDVTNTRGSESAGSGSGGGTNLSSVLNAGEKKYDNALSNNNLVVTPINPSLILFSSGLITLKMLQWIIR